MTLKKSIFALVIFFALQHVALAQMPFVIQNIRVEGIVRTELGTVFSYLPIRVGDTFDQTKATASLKALYATGFFRDVRLTADHDTLVVSVQERPTIANVTITGTKAFDNNKLTQALKNIGVGTTNAFDRASVERAEQELKHQYLSRSLYAAQITTTVTPIERNRVDIVFAIKEGEAARIKHISFVGNHVFSDKTLRKAMSLRTPGLFTWYTRADQYSKEQWLGDIETIRSHYLDRGYIEMQVESSQVAITLDKKDIYLTLNMTEGEQFKVANITLEGDMLGLEDELRSLILLRSGDVFSGKKLTESTRKISERLGNFGYAFADINAHPVLNREKKEVSFIIMIDPGKRVYVRYINIIGNTRTRDEVIRRELRQFENSWYDGAKIRLSRDRLDRLDYFKAVSIDTPAVPGATDQVDMTVAIQEKATGHIQIGAGYNQADKFSLMGKVQQENIFGSGNYLGLEVNTSKTYRTFSLTQSNPYFTDDAISRTSEIFLRTERPRNSIQGDYQVRTMGGKTIFGIPFSEIDTVFFGAGYENAKVKVSTKSPSLYQDYVRDFGHFNANGDGSATTNSIMLTLTWQRDNRNSALVPTRGRYQQINLDLSPIGQLQYYRATYRHQYFYSLLAETVTLALNGQIDYGRGFGSKPYPVFKNFYAGGIGTVRGYDSSSLGTVRDTKGDSVGGASRLFGNVELQFPLPGAHNNRTLRWFLFMDGGQVFAHRQNIKFGSLRYAAGIGLSWLSPLGPLKLSLGKALNARPGDQLQLFQFQLGASF